MPETYNPQTWNRYSYVINNPIKYNDPTGRYFTGVIVDTIICADILIVAAVVTVTLTATAYYLNETPQGREIRNDASRALEHTSKRVADRVKAFFAQVAEVNFIGQDGKFPSGFNPCKGNERLCKIGVTSFVATTILIGLTNGAGVCSSDDLVCNEPKVIRTITPTSTSTTTPTPTPTTSCVPYNGQCPPSPTNTPAPTPTNIPRHVPY